VNQPPTDTATSADEVLAELERLAAQNSAQRDLTLDRRVLRLRHRAGAALTAEANGGEHRPYPDPAMERLPERHGSALPEFGPEDLSPELLRAAILRDGCMFVRGLVDRDRALALADDIGHAFAARERLASGDSADEGYYEEFTLDKPNPQLENLRGWVASGGGVLAADAPRLAFDVLDMFSQVGLRNAIAGYLGEHPAISVEKCTLRKAEPSVAGAWHQDGAFMGDVRSLNVWLSLSRCGDEAPGLDLVPRRLDDLVPTGGDEVMIDNQISQASAERAAGDMDIIRPIFEPGDALLFDDLFLHRTASDPAMQRPRYAVESWFFAPSSFPEDYAPLAF
jgi:hypothetical protein